MIDATLITHTAKPMDTIYSAYRICYGGYGYETDEGKQGKFIKDKMRRGHLSPLEHVSFTFEIGGISRACSHQLVRHRLASYSQQSQRYTEPDPYIITPPSVRSRGSKSLEQEIFSETLRFCHNSYEQLLELGIPKEDARYIMPQGMPTSIVMTMNCRELLHFFGERLCTRAQWEIRELAEQMLYLCKQELPAVFDEAGAKCKRIGYCPEGNKACPNNKHNTHRQGE